jgi:flagellar L-ring protein precursor FlgH
MRYFVIATTLAAAVTVHSASNVPKPEGKHQVSEIDRILAEFPAPVAPSSPAGSLFTPDTPMLDLGSDLRARRANDLVTIVVFDTASAVSKGATKSARSSSAQASVTGLAGVPRSTSSLANLLKLNTDTKLDGQGETSRETTLNTTLSARVLRVLPNGLLIVEGSKSIRVNSETQLVSVRGIVRPFDLTPDNRVASDKVAALEVTVDGKGVVADAVRRPNILYRILLGILPF